MDSIKLEEGVGLDEYLLGLAEVDEDAARLARRPQVAAEHRARRGLGLFIVKRVVLVVVLASALLLLDAALDVLILLDDLLVEPAWREDYCLKYSLSNSTSLMISCSSSLSACRCCGSSPFRISSRLIWLLSSRMLRSGEHIDSWQISSISLSIRAGTSSRSCSFWVGWEVLFGRRRGCRGRGSARPHPAWTRSLPPSC